MNTPTAASIHTLLIANRGEIACRIIRTARRLGIRTLAVFAEPDQELPFVRAADAAFPLRGRTAAETYLDQETLIRIARAQGADAIHPGYGFLSENASFAARCEAAGLRFVGPPASAIEAMGSKAEAKRRMEAAGIPLIPGYHGLAQDLATLTRAAESMGFPVLLKASAGGGGKGMRVVESAQDFPAALEAAQREALKAFGESHMIIEKYIRQPRHVEVQIFFDQHGHGVYLFDRDCSVQRRHQKVIEEAPAPGIPDALRQRMGETAVSCGQAIGYVGAGTIEFLLDADGQFYFMEMNTRLQVEHPVTELVTGLDLVEWQLRIAAGEPLPRQQAQLSCQGHAVEVRLYAEDPDQGFLPSTGTLTRLSFPEAVSAPAPGSPGEWLRPASQPGGDGITVRIDAGVEQGNTISTLYDPMLAKLICHAEQRGQAIDGLLQALAQTRIAGLQTNRDYLARILRLPRFRDADLSTRLLEDEESALRPAACLTALQHRAAAILLHVVEAGEREPLSQASSSDPWSPWSAHDNWRALLPEALHQTFWQAGQEYNAELHLRRSQGDLATGFRLQGEVRLEGESEAQAFSAEAQGDHLQLWTEDQRHRLVWQATDTHLILWDGNMTLKLERPTDAAFVSHHTSSEGSLQAPMGGTIVRVLVSAGDSVKEGQPLVLMEAMKMEHAVKSPRTGCIAEVLCREGAPVQAGQRLVRLSEESDSA